LLSQSSLHRAIGSCTLVFTLVSLGLPRAGAAQTAAAQPPATSEGAAPPDGPPPPPPPAEAAPPPRPDPRLDDVDQRSRIVERKLELLDEQAAARKAAEVVLSAGERGFGFKSADGAFVIRFRGLLQVDGREFYGDDVLALRSTFLVRKARPIFDATLWDRVDFRMVPDFGGGQTVLQDAYADLRLASWLTIRGGKWKAALALERSQGDPAVVFPERGLPTFLSSNREVGFALVSSLLGGAIQLEAGVFNGGLDNGTEDRDANQAKDFIGRIFLLPFSGDPHSALARLGLGVGGSTGIERGTLTPAVGPQLPAHRTIGQETFFSYGPEVVARGRRNRLSPQLYYYIGPMGLLAEYILNSQKVLKGAETATLRHRAWQVAWYGVLGGKPLFEGTSVSAPFDPGKGTWGALELGLRYGELDIDDRSFPDFADIKRAGTRERAFGVVLNWHWSRNVKIPLAFEHTWFAGGASDGDRKPENVFFQRIQVAF
jgi:phosphate-selective porin OprO and OprP